MRGEHEDGAGPDIVIEIPVDGAVAMKPEAQLAGPLIQDCQRKMNAARSPHLPTPKHSRRYTYVPPEYGKREPSSPQIHESQKHASAAIE